MTIFQGNKCVRLAGINQTWIIALSTATTTQSCDLEIAHGREAVLKAHMSGLPMRLSILTAMFCMSIGFLVVGCKEHKPVLPPDITINPEPKQRFEITITMEKAPASLRSFKGEVQYDIENYLECVPVDYTRSLGGSTPSFDKEIGIAFRRVEGNTFRAELIGDLLLNEDYYGQGVCRWTAAGISAKLGGPDSGPPRFGIAAIRILNSGHAEARYCLTPGPARMGSPSGCTGLEAMLSSKEPKERYYKVVIQAKEK